MKRIRLFIVLFFGMIVFSINAQEKVLEEISDIEGVEVTYITKNMLQTIGKNTNINIGGINVSKIAKDLTSLQVLSVDGRTVEKVRSKLKSVGKGMEVIMKIKEDDEHTELYGIKSSQDKYSKLILSVDDRDNITVVSMTGNIGLESFRELTKKAYGYTQNPSMTLLGEKILIDLSDFDWENYQGSISSLYSNSVDVEIKEIDDQINDLDNEISKFDDEVIGGINDEIDKINEKIGKAKTSKERDKLYESRTKLFDKREDLFVKRNKLFEKRNQLFEKRNQHLFEKHQYKSYYNQGEENSKRQKNVVKIYRWDSNKKDFSVADGNVDLKWIQKVENKGVNNGYSFKGFTVVCTNKKLSSVIYRTKELKQNIGKYEKALEIEEKSKGKSSDEYIALLSGKKDLEKRLAMFEELYDVIYSQLEKHDRNVKIRIK